VLPPALTQEEIKTVDSSNEHKFGEEIITEYGLKTYNGYDFRTGFQLFEKSVDGLIAKGILNRELDLGDRLPPVTVETVPEGGGKVRVVTMEVSDVITYLEPLGHMFVEIFKLHPYTRVSMTRSFHHWEWCRAYRGRKMVQKDLFLLNNDLSEATDHCDHEICFIAGCVILEYFGLLTKYSRSALRLLCSPRRVYGYPDGEVVTSSRGVLMGDPGTKGILSLLSLMAEQESFVAFSLGKIKNIGYMPVDESPPWRNYACNGDDAIAYGPLRYIEGIAKAHILNGMEVSDKFMPTKRLAKYCNNYVYIDMFTVFDLGAGGYSPYSLTLPVDSLNLKLLSDVQKGHSVEDEKNPSIGKAGQLGRDLLWAPPGWKEFLPKVAISRFLKRMGRLLPGYDIVSLPRVLGGLGLTINVDWDTVWALMHPLHVGAIRTLMEYGENSPVPLMRVLGSFCSCTYMRGTEKDQILDDILDANPDLLVSLQEAFRLTCISYKAKVDRMMADAINFDEMDTPKLKYDFVKSNNYFERLEDFRDRFDRASVFRDLITGNSKKKSFRTRSWNTIYWNFIKKIQQIGVEPDNSRDILPFLQGFQTGTIQGLGSMTFIRRSGTFVMFGTRYSLENMIEVRLPSLRISQKANPRIPVPMNVVAQPRSGNFLVGGILPTGIDPTNVGAVRAALLARKAAKAQEIKRFPWE
jgi:hypothetical protein